MIIWRKGWDKNLNLNLETQCCEIAALWLGTQLSRWMFPSLWRAQELISCTTKHHRTRVASSIHHLTFIVTQGSNRNFSAWRCWPRARHSSWQEHLTSRHGTQIPSPETPKESVQFKEHTDTSNPTVHLQMVYSLPQVCLIDKVFTIFFSEMAIELD